MYTTLINQHIDDVLKSTNFTGMGRKVVGKVRDIYVGRKTITLISTDRHSSFDRIIAHIPFKGEVLNQISAFWFENTKDIIQNHVLSIPDPNVLVARKCIPLPIECVMRGYITGVTSTSLWSHYAEGRRDFGNFVLPDRMKKNQKLPHNVFTPTTKSNEHDKPITLNEIVSEGLLTKKMVAEVERVSQTLFARGQQIALSRGLILVDTKYEFGIDTDGKLTLIDEIHTPDSSRYWKSNTYHARFITGQEPEYFDKEFMRLWFKDRCDPYRDKVLPAAPKKLVAELSRRYIEIFETITDTPFVHDFRLTSVNRIKKNLSSSKLRKK